MSCKGGVHKKRGERYGLRVKSRTQGPSTAVATRATEQRSRSVPRPPPPRLCAHEAAAPTSSAPWLPDPSAAAVTAAGPRGPALVPSVTSQSAPSKGGADASGSRPYAAARFKRPRGACPAANSCGGRGRLSMQSAMFLAVQHDCVPMDKSAGNGPKVEEKREKMKRTL